MSPAQRILLQSGIATVLLLGVAYGLATYEMVRAINEDWIERHAR